MDSKAKNLQSNPTDRLCDKPIDVELLRKEAELGRREAFERYLDAVSDVPPQHNNDSLDE